MDRVRSTVRTYVGDVDADFCYQGVVNRRNADFSHIYRTMEFSRSPNLLNNASAWYEATSTRNFVSVSACMLKVLWSGTLISRNTSLQKEKNIFHQGRALLEIGG